MIGKRRHHMGRLNKADQRETAGARAIPIKPLLVLLALAALSGCGGGASDIDAGRAAEKRDNHEEAIRLYTRALLHGNLSRENEANALFDRGIAYRKKGFLDKAVDDFDAALTIRPDFADAYEERGVAHDKKGDFDSAIADYDAAIRLKPNFAGAYNDRGYVRQEKGEYAKAIADYDVALRLEPENFRAYTNRGTSYQRLSQYDKAIADFTAVIGLKPQNLSAAYDSRGLAYNATGRFDEAIADFSEAIRLSPDFANAFAHRALAYHLKGQYGRAIADYDNAIRLKGGDPNVHGNRGLSKFALGQFTDAAVDFEQGVRSNPSNPYWPLWLHLARSRTGVNDADEFARNAARIDRGKWPGAVVALFLGQATPTQVREAAAQGDAKVRRNQHCEAVFYTGEFELQRRDLRNATSFLRQAEELCPADFIQYAGITTELSRLPGAAETTIKEKPTAYEIPPQAPIAGKQPGDLPTSQPVSLLAGSTSLKPPGALPSPASTTAATTQTTPSAPAPSAPSGKSATQQAPEVQPMAANSSAPPRIVSSGANRSANPALVPRQIASLPISDEWHVQLGAVRSSEEAKRVWEQLQSKSPDILGALTLRIQRADLGGSKGVFYRVQAGPFSDKGSAASACNRLKAAQIDCLAVKG